MHHKAKTAVEVGYQKNDAESDYFDYHGLKGYIGGIFPLIQNLSALGGLQYRYLDYLNQSENRIDRKITTDLGLSYTLVENYTFQLKYRYARNDSIDRYTWQKHVISLSALFEF
jgi:uncharacterized protein (PEP-CTERM system associated)